MYGWTVHDAVFDGVLHSLRLDRLHLDDAHGAVVIRPLEPDQIGAQRIVAEMEPAAGLGAIEADEQTARLMAGLAEPPGRDERPEQSLDAVEVRLAGHIGAQIEQSRVEQLAQLLQQVIEILVADVGVVFADHVTQRPTEGDRRPREPGDVALAVAAGHDPQRPDPKIPVDLPVRDRRPRNPVGNPVERLAELALLMHGEVRGSGRRQAAHQVVVILEGPTRSRLQLDRLMQLSIRDPPWYRQRLDRMERRPGGIHLSRALVEADHEVVEVVGRRSDLLARQVAYLEGEQAVRRDRSEDSRDPVLLGLIEPEFDADLRSRMSVHGEVRAAEALLVRQVRQHAQVRAGIRRIDQPQAVAAL